jgi:FlaA1/EpsC-like NDP-sugar epimerase
VRPIDQSRPRSHGSRAAKFTVLGADALAIAAAMALAALIRAAEGHASQAIGPLSLVAVLALPVWLAVFARYKLYKTAAVASQQAEISRILHAVAAATVCTALVAIVLATSISRAWLLLTFVIALVFVIAERTVVRSNFRRARLRGRLQRRVVVVGTNAEALGVVQMLGTDKDLGYEVVGLVECGAGNGIVSPVPVVLMCV